MDVGRTKSGINTDVSLGLNCKLPSVSADEVAIYARELSLYEGVNLLFSKELACAPTFVRPYGKRTRPRPFGKSAHGSDRLASKRYE